MKLQSSTIQRTSVLAIVIFAALLQTSCLSARNSGANTRQVEVAGSGIIRFRGEPVSVTELGSELRSAGYKSMSTIKIHVPNDVSEMTIKTITMSLSKSGFRRVLFVKPQHATADVSKQK